MECGAKEIRGSGLGELAGHRAGGLPTQGGSVPWPALLYSGGLELVGADPLPWGPAEARRLGAGGEGWWGLVVRGQPPGCATVCFFFLRPQIFLLLNILEILPKKSTGPLCFLRWAWESWLAKVPVWVLMSLYDVDWDRPTQQEGRLVDIELVSPTSRAIGNSGETSMGIAPSPAQDGVQQEQGRILSALPSRE